VIDDGRHLGILSPNSPRGIIQLPYVQVRLPPVDELAEKWAIISRLLHKATVRTGCYEPIDLLQLAMRGQVGIWICEVGGDVAAAVATEIKQYPRRRILEIMFTGGGNMQSWLPMLVETLDEHARQAGCSHIATAGRPGWTRAWGGELTGDVVIVRGLKDQR
jgi:hypothetical protein